MGLSDFKRLKSLNERKVLRGFTAAVRCLSRGHVLLHILFQLFKV